MLKATVGVRRRFLSLIRPLAELMRRWRPSQSNQTGVTCGVPSGLMVARLAKAFLALRTSLNPSGTVVTARSFLDGVRLHDRAAVHPHGASRGASSVRMRARASARPRRA